MTRYYCDYCDIFLTHDAPRVRKDHNSGWKHAMQVRAHYQGTGKMNELAGCPAHVVGINQDKMQRALSEVIKDYQVRGELVPVPAPMMMRPPPGMRPPYPSGMGAMGVGMRPSMQMTGPIPSGTTPIHSMGVAPPMYPPGGTAGPVAVPLGGMYPPPPVQSMPEMLSQTYGPVSNASTAFPAYYPPPPQMDPHLRPPHLQPYQSPSIPTAAPWHVASGPTTTAPLPVPQQASHLHHQDHQQQRN